MLLVVGIIGIGTGRGIRPYNIKKQKKPTQMGRFSFLVGAGPASIHND